MLPVTRTAWFRIGAGTVLLSALAIVTGMVVDAAIFAGFIPARLSGLDVQFIAVPTLLTTLTSTLVHGDFTHLSFNMLFLALTGRIIEQVLGRWGVATLYIFSAYVAAIAQWLVGQNDVAPMIGASGAVSGMIGALVIAYSTPRSVLVSRAANRWLNIVWIIATWTVLQWAMGFAMGLDGTNVAVAAHIGGFVAGMAAFWPLVKWKYRRA
ncbi:rhomboid family intramembrane serine protease [Sphingomicrobium flavum]|uniref:rhomboid family intramembrane serine protease n=1 Tax=Sphingomicrobium flavum TaxID=1229164 RepID=UPI0021AE1C6B|nr:rhomboid family intramembrane serine protease [Sphingomicrobium flavum]